MTFVHRLLVRLLLVLAVPEALSVYLTFTLFPFTPAQIEDVRWALPLLLVVGTAAVIAALTRAAAPVECALAEDGGTTPEEQQRAARTALRLPGRAAAFVVTAGTVITGIVVALEIRGGVSWDVALAALGVGIACTLLSAMAAYAASDAASAPALARLGAGDMRGGRTFRGKVLVLCFGMTAVSGLLITSAGYARFRADTDDEYVAGASAALDTAARSLETGRPEAAVELASAGTSGPVMVVGPDGRVLAQVGDVPWAARELAAKPEGVEQVPAGWQLRRRSGPYTLVASLPDAPLWKRRAAFIGQIVPLGLLLLAAAAVVIWFAAESLAAPLGFLRRAADRIAAGDLTAQPPSVSRDEMGRLAEDFRKMAKGLAGLVGEVKSAGQGIQDGIVEIGRIGERVKGGARGEHDHALAAGAAVQAMQSSVSSVAAGVKGLAAPVHATGAALTEMATSLEEVRSHAAELDRRMSAASEDVERLSVSGRRALAQIRALEALGGNAHDSLVKVAGSLSGLEMSAVSGQLAAAQAAELADTAGTIVAEAAGGIESLRSAVDDAKKRVAVLGRRSDDIDKITDFIGEVAGRTNLLSLNASIIATQAGEHGKAFAVVAEQIRELASQISSSTKSIGEIIRTTREDVQGTARLIQRSDELAMAGVGLTQKSLDTLRELRSASFKGHETAAEIRNAVQEHAQSTQDASDLVTSVTDTIDSLSEAMEMVEKSVATVTSVSRGAGELADGLSRALEEDADLGKRQIERVGQIDRMLADITRAVQDHQGVTTRVRDTLSQLAQFADQHEAAVVELSHVGERLDSRSRALAERVGRFKI